jgi:hypothetical protein
MASNQHPLIVEESFSPLPVTVTVVLILDVMVMVVG